MTNWTKKQYADLNKNFSQKFEILDFDCTSMVSWIFIMELCVQYEIESIHFGTHVFARKGEFIILNAYYLDHKNSKSLTERVARCLALLGGLDEL